MNKPQVAFSENSNNAGKQAVVSVNLSINFIGSYFTNDTKKMDIKEPIKGASFVTAGELTWETVDNGVERKILGYDDHLMMVVVRFEKGAIGSLHHHVHRQISYVETGRFEVTIDGRKKILEQGDTFFVAPDLVHGVVALEKGSLVDIFTPARMDFLK
jgi:quercetin dioxygenase-like cupin family protein